MINGHLVNACNYACPYLTCFVIVLAWLWKYIWIVIIDTI